MFQANSSAKQSFTPEVDVNWSEGGETRYLGTLGARLWKLIERELGRNPSAWNEGNYSDLLELGAFQLSIRVLSRRNRSRQWICEHLAKAGIPPKIAQRVAGKMEQRGFACEHTLQESLLLQAKSKMRGSHWLQRESQKRRMSEGGISAVLRRGTAEEVGSITRWLDRHFKGVWQEPTAAERVKLFQKLLRRGFKLASIESAFDLQRNREFSN